MHLQKLLLPELFGIIVAKKKSKKSAVECDSEQYHYSVLILDASIILFLVHCDFTYSRSANEYTRATIYLIIIKQYDLYQ